MLHEELINEVRNSLSCHGCSDINLEAVEVNRNNVILEGIKAMKGNIGITFYPTEMQTAHEISHEIMEQLNKAPDFSDLAVNLTDKDWILDHVYPLLVSKTTDNEDNPILQGKIARGFLDMALIYYIEITKDDNGIGAMYITEEIFNILGIDLRELRDYAMWNIYRKMRFTSMLDKLHEIAPELKIPEEAEDNMLYYLGVEGNMNGAALIANEAAMEEIHQKLGCDFYILPSSKHEVIIIPERNNDIDIAKVEAFYNMVKLVNETEVAPDNKLTDNVYYYDDRWGVYEVA